MHNKEIARLLWETADLMEIAGEDSFRIRSYRNGATAIEGHTESVSGIASNADRKLTEIPGIGKGLAFVVQEIVTRGSCERRDELLGRRLADWGLDSAEVTKQSASPGCISCAARTMK